MLTYAGAVNATGVAIHETYVSGSVIQVDYLEPDGTSHTVWSGSDTTVCGGWLELSHAPTSYLVKQVRVHTAIAAWEEIDAVRLDGATGPTSTPTATYTPSPTPLEGSTTVWVDPPEQTAYLSEGTFSVDIAVTDVVNLGSFEFTLAFSPTIVHMEGAELGDFLGSTGCSAIPVSPEIYNEAGTVTFGAFSFGEPPAPDGSGVLATISFSPQAEGESNLHLHNVKVTNTAAEVIPVELQDGHITVVE